MYWNLNEVFDIDKLPERRLGMLKTVLLSEHSCVDAAVRFAKRAMAMRLADTVLEGEPFFTETRYTVGGYAKLELRADCVVLTAEEYAELKREAFERGLKHATMPNAGFALTGFEPTV